MLIGVLCLVLFLLEANDLSAVWQVESSSQVWLFLTIAVGDCCGRVCSVLSVVGFVLCSRHSI